MELNRVTPRIFVAATRQDDGKTTSSVGLYHALQNFFQSIGYIKPVGQRYVEIEGQKIDEDSVLISETYKVRLPLNAMSPLAVDSGFTRRYLMEQDPKELEPVVIDAFNRAAWEQEFVIIEGSGHAGVGSVFNLSNARVAQLLDSKAIIVSQGGVGRPLDEIALNKALFDKFDVEVIGVIFNKVIPEKIDELRPYYEMGLNRLGLELLGIMPMNQELRKPSLKQVCHELGGNFLANANLRRRLVSRVHIGAMTARNTTCYFQQGTLLITPGDREDIILACIEEEVRMAGVILSDGLLPQSGLIKIMNSRSLPFIAVPDDTHTVASKIDNMTVKTEPDDGEKIKLIQQMIEQNVRVDKILHAAAR